MTKVVLFEVVTSLGNVRYVGTRTACKMFCSMYDRYGRWTIRKQTK